MTELGALIRGDSYLGISYVDEEETNAAETKDASSPLERQFKLKELAKLVRD